MRKPPLCIYHGRCDDGFGAAWAIARRFGESNVELVAGVYGKPLPVSVVDRDVIMVDFSFKRPVLDEMAQVVRSMLILDHHKTAAEDLAGFPKPAPLWEMHLEAAEDAAMAGELPVFASFDMNRSGAMMAWDYFHPGEEPPALIKHIQDRDLWRFELPGTREFSMALRSYPMDFAQWDRIAAADPFDIIIEGRTITRFYDAKILELKNFAWTEVIGGFEVPVCNAPWAMASDLANELAKGHYFAAAFYEERDQVVFSLRSREGEPQSLDVSKVAAQYGGGGHKHAAGFRVAKSRTYRDPWPG